jgi:hypothetical protein
MMREMRGEQVHPIARLTGEQDRSSKLIDEKEKEFISDHVRSGAKSINNIVRRYDT